MPGAPRRPWHRRQCPFVLDAATRQALEAVTRQLSQPAGLVRRARCILLWADGVLAVEIARRLGLSRRHVYKWVRRFEQAGMAGLQDASTPRGRKPRAGVEAEIV
jgi:Winged helix-turn helix